MTSLHGTIRCRICRSDTELDDMAVPGGPDRCICLRCCGRATGTERPMPRALQRALVTALAACLVA